MLGNNCNGIKEMWISEVIRKRQKDGAYPDKDFLRPGVRDTCPSTIVNFFPALVGDETIRLFLLVEFEEERKTG